MAHERILLIEDDPAIVAGLELNLSLEGYQVVSASDGERGLRIASETPPDLVLLDIMLPGMNGLEVLRQLRQRDPDIPVLVLTARGEEADKVLGLQMGADDYISKPFSVSELRARVNAFLRRKRLQASTRPVQQFGDVEVDIDSHRVARRGRDVPLTAREFSVLTYFLRHPARVINRETLLHAVWKMEYLSQRTIDNFIARLRAKLEPDPENPRYFLTVRGVGYRFEPDPATPQPPSASSGKR
jgi:DNA-binding response OmpR family regulator